MPSRAEKLLQAIGLGIWLFVGVPTLRDFFTGAEQPGSVHGVLWLLAYFGFGAGFWLATSQAPLIVKRVALLAQSAAALGLMELGLIGFEGSLLAVVAAQTPGLFPIGVAALWAIAQGVPLFIICFPSHHLLGSARGTGAYLAFSGFAMAASYLRQREVQARLELGRMNGELVATQRLLADTSRLSERLRIARELHDALGHHLIALNLQLELEQQRAGEAPGPVAEARTIVKQMLADVREVVGALRKEGGLDVGRAILALAASMPEPRVHCELPERMDPVDPERAHTLFRCVQEAITNSVKHGDARNVWVRIEQTDDALGLHFRDDGRGATRVTFGNGLRGMRERVAHLGGQLAVSSELGHGFELRASIPLGSPG
jgi:signal transduction histidine kinase